MRLGNDADRLDVLAHELATGADDLVAAASDLVWAMAVTTWWGPIHDRVVDDLARIVRNGTATADALRAFGAVARAQGAAQRRVSATASHPTATVTMLWSDDHGDGRRIAVVGDLAAATHLVVLVPGMGSTAANFGHVLDEATRLQHDAADELGGRGRIAVVAWLGYDAPAGLGDPRRIGQVLGRGRADAGATALAEFIDRLDPSPATVVTLVGHSYGSLVVAGAARGDDRIDRVVVLGSPGLGVDHVGDLGLAPGTELLAAAAPADAVARSEWFGTDPADPSFGVTVLDAHPWPGVDGPGPGHAHSSYFDAGSQILDNLVGVVTGRGERLEFSGTR